MTTTKGPFQLEVGNKFNRSGIVWEVIDITDLGMTRRKYTIKRTDVEFFTSMRVDAYQACKPFEIVE